MPGTLVLHVVKGDQDYASLLGNDFMRQAGKSKGNDGRVTVLTHCDKLEQSSPSDAQRLQTTLDATGENSSLTFAIHGCAQDHTEEDAALKHLPAMDGRVEVGAKPLAAHLEERMRVHLATQYPKAVAKLEESLAETLRRLELVKEKSPLEVLFEMSASVQANHQAKRQGLMNELRVTLDQMTRSIKNFELRPLCSRFGDCRPLDSFDEPLEVGAFVYYRKDSTQPWDPYCVSGLDASNTNLSLKRKLDDEAETPVVLTRTAAAPAIAPTALQAALATAAQEPSFNTAFAAKPAAFAATASPPSSPPPTAFAFKPAAALAAAPASNSTGLFPGVSSGESGSIDAMVQDIKQLAADRGIRNVVHADRQPIIARYAEEFGHHYQRAMQATLKTIRKSVGGHFDAVFSEAIPEMAKPAAARLRSLMRNEESEALLAANAAIDAMAAHNTMEDLIFSPNEHYLNSLIQKMVEADTGMATDDGGARHIYHNVRAYIKVQTKYISELGSKELVRTMVLNNEERFRTVMTAKAGACVDLIKEPSSVARERSTLLTRKKALEEALKKLEAVDI